MQRAGQRLRIHMCTDMPIGMYIGMRIDVHQHVFIGMAYMDMAYIVMAQAHRRASTCV